LVTLALLAVAFACFVGVVVVRQGPPSGGDTVPLTSVTSALAAGDLHRAASVESLPNPPGYGLLTAPLVAVFPSLVGSPNWCTTPGRVDTARPHAPAASPPLQGALVDECGTVPGLPPWERSQGVLGLAAWLVLALGSLALLRARGADTVARQAGLLAFLAFLPAASAAVSQLYHPQDTVSLGLALAGLAQTIRRRWLLAGVLFGVAVLTKQFALLVLLPALVAAPGLQARIRLGGSAVVVFAAGVAPFLLADPRSTIDNLSGFSAGGALAGQTVISLLGASGAVVTVIARDAPVLFAGGVSLWAAVRVGSLIDRPVALVALTLSCAGGRLLFEPVIFPYYLLATSVLFLLLDLVAERSPHRSLAWCAAAAFFVAFHPQNRGVEAAGCLVLAAVAVVAGLLEVARTEPVLAAGSGAIAGAGRMA
jgi:hypothetical protein